MINECFFVFSDPLYKYPSLFRYLSDLDFEDIFIKKRLPFKKTKLWQESSDPLEVFYEDWWQKTDNSRYLLKKIIDGLSSYKEYGNDTYMTIWKSVYQHTFERIIGLQSPTYSLCLAETWTNPKMKKEYHDNSNRHLVVEFENNFLHDLVLFNNYIPTSKDHLYIDIFPMQYICSLESFCQSLCDSELILNKEKWGNYFYNKGQFIKDNRFSYESEVRAKIGFSINEIRMQYSAYELHMRLHHLVNASEIINESMDILTEVKTLWEKYGSENYKYIPIKKPLGQIIKRVILSSESDVSYGGRVRDVCMANNLDFEVLNYNMFCC